MHILCGQVRAPCQLCGEALICTVGGQGLASSSHSGSLPTCRGITGRQGRRRPAPGQAPIWLAPGHSSWRWNGVGLWVRGGDFSLPAPPSPPCCCVPQLTNRAASLSYSDEISQNRLLALHFPAATTLSPPGGIDRAVDRLPPVLLSLLCPICLSLLPQWGCFP